MSALTYGWERKNDPASFRLAFQSCTRESLSWKEELYAAARAIANRTHKPIWICASGGIDSEVACRAFFDQGINFSVLTLQHASGTNLHDIQFAIDWCRDHGVYQKIVTIDITRFLSEEVDSYAMHYPAYHPFRYLQLKLMDIVESLGGYAVLCSGEQLFQVDRTKQALTRADIFLPLSNGNAVPLEWCKDHATDHEPYFHFSTPELCLSYIRMPLVDFVLTNPEEVFRHESNVYTLKRVVYQSVWSDLKVRYKSHGFERVRTEYDAATARLRERFEKNFIRVELPIIAFEQQLLGTA